jgi:polysaccharide export outer membrane protein
MQLRQVLLVLLAAFLCGCALKGRATVEPEVSDLSEDRQFSSLLTSDAQTMRLHTSANEPPYLVRFGDQLDVQLLSPVQSQIRLLVRPDGRISLPITGEHSVVGKTISEVEHLIHDSFDRTYRTPVIYVNVESVAKVRYYIFGEISSPGVYESVDPVNALQLIAMAGGNTEKAKLSNVILLRNFGDGQIHMKLLDLVIDQDQTETSELLSPLSSFDTIIVPKRVIHSIHQVVDDYVIQFLPPIDLYLRGLYFSLRD